MSLEQMQQNLAELMEFCALLRGRYINEFTSLEYSMEEIIVKYYTNNDPVKQSELWHSLVGQQTFNTYSKRQLVAYISAKYTGNHNKLNKIDGLLQDILKIRNTLSHWKQSLTTADMKNWDKKNVKLICFATYDKKDVADELILNEEYIKEGIHKIKYCHQLISNLHNMIVLNKKPEGSNGITKAE